MGKPQLDLLCDYIRENPTLRITLNDMERVSGMSARALQYAFLQHYHCTPMQWLRDARLETARGMLSQPDFDLAIGVVAKSLGFSKHSTFSAFFTTRFGESPSALIARVRGS